MFLFPVAVNEDCWSSSPAVRAALLLFCGSDPASLPLIMPQPQPACGPGVVHGQQQQQDGRLYFEMVYNCVREERRKRGGYNFGPGVDSRLKESGQVSLILKGNSRRPENQREQILISCFFFSFLDFSLFTLLTESTSAST